jgi:hypothetical protein
VVSTLLSHQKEAGAAARACLAPTAALGLDHVVSRDNCAAHLIVIITIYCVDDAVALEPDKRLDYDKAASVARLLWCLMLYTVKRHKRQFFAYSRHRSDPKICHAVVWILAGLGHGDFADDLLAQDG